jgi:hypothetical protein
MTPSGELLRSFPLMQLFAVKFEAGRQRTPQLANFFQRLLLCQIARDFQDTAASEVDFDGVALLQVLALNHGRWKPDAQAVSPF